ncbi:MAG TPA: HEAT repeat domain-containing protein [Planctomycetota bacterium]|nr:HEAT repeat domain-containing protein [Planctomycetota bacterium]OQC20290.1 MAG: hypothetical protein BWX69_01932 [Planctomycetes bacterium ADurb.Bin069]HNR99932.1 HEAT repeat domain-containing protein [Planctomycetota bacterium]HNU24838.1 HEAT repeat domain-containing protein [Planctomycetota bacterium]HOE29440.1 HEAT repeat domain-containing protein [Planctomycetota bacterium]
MRREEETLVQLERLVESGCLTSAPELREAVDATASLLSTLAEGASPKAFRAVVLLGKALERLACGIWPPSADVRAFLRACVDAAAMEIGVDLAAAAAETAAAETAVIEPVIMEPVVAEPVVAEPRGDPDSAGAAVDSADFACSASLDYSSDCLCAAGIFTSEAVELAAYKERIRERCIDGAPEALETLVAILNSSVHFELRAVAARCLGEFGPERAANALRAALRDESAAVRAAAFGALAGFGGEVGERAMAQAAADEDASVRFEAQLRRSRPAGL